MTVDVQFLYDATGSFDDITENVEVKGARLVGGISNTPGDLDIRVRDKARIYAPGYFRAGREFICKINGEPTWGGFVMAVQREYAFEVDDTGVGRVVPRFWHLSGFDYNLMWRKLVYFDKLFPSNTTIGEYPVNTSDQDVVREILDRFSVMGALPIGIDIVSGIEEVGPIDPYQDVNVGSAGEYLETVIGRINLFNGAVTGIDPEKVVRYVDDVTETAPFALSDNPGSGEVGYREVTINGEGFNLGNDALVWGAGKGINHPVFARVQDSASIAEHGRFQWGDIFSGMWVQQSVDRRADVYVNGSPSHHRGHKDDVVRIICTVREPGLIPGMGVRFESQVYDGQYDDVYPIRKMEMEFPTHDSVLYRLTLSHELDAAWAYTDPLPPLAGPPGPGPFIEFEVPPPTTLSQIELDMVYTVRGLREFAQDAYTPPASTDVGITNTIYAYDDPGPAHVVHHDYTYQMTNMYRTRTFDIGGFPGTVKTVFTGTIFDTLKESTFSTIVTAAHRFNNDDVECWFQIPAGMTGYTQMRVTGRVFTVTDQLPVLTFRYSPTPPPAHDYVDYPDGTRVGSQPPWPGELGDYLPVYVNMNPVYGSTTDVLVDIPPLEAGYLGVFLGQRLPSVTPPESVTLPYSGGVPVDNTILRDMGMATVDQIHVYFVRQASLQQELFARFDPLTCIYYTLYPYVAGTLAVYVGGTTASAYIPVAAGSNGAQAVMNLALAQIGKPYILGTEGPNAFDCSGLVYFCFNQTGQISLVGGTRRRAQGYRNWFIAQSRFTTSSSALVPGNLIIYGANAEHIAIYLGNGKAISALNPSQGVLIHRWDGLGHDVAGFCVPDYGGTVIDTTDYGDGDEVPPDAIEAVSGVDFVEVDPDLGSFKLLHLCEDLSQQLTVSYVPIYEIGGGTPPATIADPSADANGTSVYRPRDQMQLGWGTRYDGVNCGMTAAAMALDRHTLGAYSATNGYPLATPPNMRNFSGVTAVRGTNLEEAAAAWYNGWRQTLTYPGATSWAYFVARITEGRGAICAGDYEVMPPYLKKQASFDGDHSIFINEMLADGSFWGFDPLYRAPLIYPANVLRAYMEDFGEGRIKAAYTQITARVVA